MTSQLRTVFQPKIDNKWLKMLLNGLRYAVLFIFTNCCQQGIQKIWWENQNGGLSDVII